MAELTISEDRLFIEPRDAIYSAGEFAALRFPPCPVCGATVEVQRIDVTLNAEAEAQHGRQYIAGMWNCRHGCDPRAMERRHFSQSARTGPGLPGLELSCSCGDTSIVLTEAEAREWRDIHTRSAGA